MKFYVKTIKRILALVLVLAMIACLAACGGNTQTGSANGNGGGGSSFSADNAFDSNPMVWHLYNSATSSQITTFIQQQEYRCQDKLNQMNDVLANMNKEIK